MSKRNPGAFEPSPFDYYPTPRKAVLPLIPHLRAARVRRFAEPCAGEGDLIRHLESFGLVCNLASDLADGQDALHIPRFDDGVITNIPYSPGIRDALIAHFIEAALAAWLLLKSDWAFNKKSPSLLTHCLDIVAVGRLRLFEGTPNHSTDNFAWLRFCRDHHTGPIFHHRGARPTSNGRSLRCPAPYCGRLFAPGRSDQRFCSHRLPSA